MVARRTGTIRLHLLCSASTCSRNAVAFASDGSLDSSVREGLSKLPGHLSFFNAVLRSPSLCAGQTAEMLGLEAAVLPQLRDCDFGSWIGLSLEEVRLKAPEGLAVWLRDPRAAPHGGESFVDVVRRVGQWMDGLSSNPRSILAISHTSVIRAAIVHALGVGPDSFRHIDIAPLTRAELSAFGERWTFSALVPLKDVR
ncbi:MULTISPECIES: histidine phosphatase family protein [Bradyrhizobium]|uniref:Histidine phosphatase family protein n=2 Tax=Bradyrhizobium TaxID=374 RepID=A0A973X0T3_9BRAD|nr:histidine phosphatase family protein [Bradyrhizobium quebecense]